MSDFSVRVEGIDRLARRYGEAGRTVGEELVRMVDRLTITGEAESKRLVGKDTRHLMRSIAHTPAGMRGSVAVGDWGTNVPYAEVHELGRRPGAAMPPAGVLLPWMRRHGIPAEAEFVVRRAIGRRGIPGKFYMRDALVVVRRKARAEMRATAARIVARLRGR